MIPIYISLKRNGENICICDKHRLKIISIILQDFDNRFIKHQFGMFNVFHTHVLTLLYLF